MDLIIVGASGFGREVLQWVKDINRANYTWNILGFIDDNPDALDGFVCDYSVIGTIKDWVPKDHERFVLAIANPAVKEYISKSMKEKGAVFTSVVHPTAFISEFAEVGEGLVMYPNAGINVNTKVGDFVTFLSSGMGHDAVIGDYCTISSYCDITGGVMMGKRVFLGSHCTIVPHRKIGDDAYVSAGSVVMTNLKPGVHVMGNPAKKIDF